LRLTPREVAVLALVADGHTAGTVARRLLIGERTVHKHLQHLYAKLDVTDRLSAVLAAQRLGILPPSPAKAGAVKQRRPASAAGGTAPG
jgi:DNA-binding NarL/FixJ family response regulator